VYVREGTYEVRPSYHYQDLSTVLDPIQIVVGTPPKVKLVSKTSSFRAGQTLQFEVSVILLPENHLAALCNIHLLMAGGWLN